MVSKTLARIQGVRHCSAIVKSEGERASFVHEPIASQGSPARSHSCSLSLGRDHLFLTESSVPSVSRLVRVFAASWDALRETVCLDLISSEAASSCWKPKSPRTALQPCERRGMDEAPTHAWQAEVSERVHLRGSGWIGYTFLRLLSQLPPCSRLSALSAFSRS